MKEKLYTIPVTDAFASPCECPICVMKKELEDNAIDFTMGPSYMEDDIREVTDSMGFCSDHIKLLYLNKNKLGLALMLKTHLDKTIKDLEKLNSSNKTIAKASIFKKKDNETNDIVNYLNRLHSSCFVCQRIDDTFHRYINTIFYLYKTEKDFKDKFSTCKGFCNDHYALLYREAPKHLNNEVLQEFIYILNEIYLANMKRVRDDVSWFIDKFDYRYTNEPWKNSKDALPRAMTKTNSIL